MVTPANNYAPPKSEVADVVPDDDIKASRGARLGASIIDGLLIGGAMTPAYFHAIPLIARAGPDVPRNSMAIWAVVASTGGWFYLGLICGLIVLIINGILAYQNGQTIAKKLLGIKDVRTDGSRVSFARIFWMRNVISICISFIPIVGGFYGLIDSLFLFGSAKRCVHDYIADTIVVRA
jgi:uncharacterized RDD family membrane protein YckC